MHENAREEFTNIRVTREGRWFTGAKEIVNTKVISYFKQNLFRDAKGIYIYQTFREFAEKGYITTAGPLLTLFRADAATLTFDSMDSMETAAAKVVIDGEDECPYIFYPRLACYASVPAAVAPDFSQLLSEDDENFRFNGRVVPREIISTWG